METGQGEASNKKDKQTTTGVTNTPKQQKATSGAHKDTALQAEENLQTATVSPEAAAQPDPQQATLASSPENNNDQKT